MLRKKLALLALPLVATLSLQAQNPLDDPFFNDPFGDDIFKEMMQMQRDMDKMFERMQQRMQQRSSGQVNPLGTYKIAVRNQLEEKGNVYELRTNIPESKENHIDIKTANGMMYVSAKIVQEEESKNSNMLSRSRSVRMYQQSTPLAKDADESKISTEYRDGKLVIIIGKKPGVKPNIVINNVPQKPKAEKKEPSTENVLLPNTESEKKAVEITKEFEQTAVKTETK